MKLLQNGFARCELFWAEADLFLMLDQSKGLEEFVACMKFGASPTLGYACTIRTLHQSAKEALGASGFVMGLADPFTGSRQSKLAVHDQHHRC